LPRVSDGNLETFRGVLALDGSFDAFDRYFSWDINGMYQQNRNVQKTFGNINLTRLRTAVGPSFINAGGQAQCGTPTAPIALGVGQNSCVPFNPFLSAGVTGLGGLTGNRQLQEYLFQTETAQGKTATSIFSANLTGTVFEMPAGDLAFATGVELRRESGEFVPDALAVTGESTNLSSRATRGEYGVDEVYAEFRIPLLADMAFVRSLDITAASRYSDYDTFGDTTNSKIGIEYRPIDDLLIRGTFAEGFRAPTISNLFAGGSQSFVFYTDPCDPIFGQAQASNPASAAIRANCSRDIQNYANFRQLRQGFTPAQGPNEQTPLAFFQGTGNEELTPETSESFSVGLVYSPEYVDGLNLSLDYWRIDIEDLIIGDTIGQILADCYVSGISARCAPTLFTRDPVLGIVNSANIGLRNAGYNEVEGYDLGVIYRFETDFGNFSINNQSTYTARDEFKSSNDAAVLPTQNVSFGSTFRIRSNTTFGWNMGAWGVNWTTRYFSAIKESCLAATLPGRVCSNPTYVAANPAQTRAINRTGSVSFNDLQVRYNAPWDATISVGANNVLDRVGPPLYSQPSANVNYYGGFDIGRFWYLSYSQRF
jgi:iron complex outermembrane recepter protein